MTPHWHASLKLLAGLVGAVLVGALVWLLLDAFAPAVWVNPRPGIKRDHDGAYFLIAAPFVGALLGTWAWSKLVKASCPTCGERAMQPHAEEEGLIYRCPCGAAVDVVND